MLKPLRLILLSMLIGMLTTGVALARTLQQGENCTFPADSQVKGTLFVFCQHLTIAGKIEGNLIGIGLRTTITGEVGKNVYLVGLTLDHQGTIRGDLHYVGLKLKLDSANAEPQRPVQGQLIFGALSANLGAPALLPGPITGFGYQLLIDGEVRGEVSYWGSALVVNNAIRGDVYASVGNPESDATDVETLLLPLDIEFAAVAPGLTITGDGRISGQLEYFGPAEAIIDGAVDGAIEYYSTTPVLMPDLPQQGLATLFFDQFKRELTVLLTAGLLSLALASKQFQGPLSNLHERPVRSFVIGMLLFIISFPIVLIVLIATTIVILLPVVLNLDGVALAAGAFLTLFDVGVIGIFYFTAIFIARAVFALELGRLALQIASGRDSARRMPRISLLIGVGLLAMVASLPVVGFLFNAGALFMGLGAIASALMEWLHALRAGQIRSLDAAGYTQSSRPEDRRDFTNEPLAQPNALPRLPMPTADLGLEDLPDGFDPDFFFADD